MDYKIRISYELIPKSDQQALAEETFFALLAMGFIPVDGVVNIYTEPKYGTAFPNTAKHILIRPEYLENANGPAFYGGTMVLKPGFFPWTPYANEPLLPQWYMNGTFVNITFSEKVFLLADQVVIQTRDLIENAISQLAAKILNKGL